MTIDDECQKKITNKILYADTNPTYMVRLCIEETNKYKKLN